MLIYFTEREKEGEWMRGGSRIVEHSSSNGASFAFKQLWFIKSTDCQTLNYLLGGVKKDVLLVLYYVYTHIIIYLLVNLNLRQI